MQNEYIKKYVETTRNKKPMKLNLNNGVILNLEYDYEIQAYRGYWEEEKKYIGIWFIKDLTNFICDADLNISVILNN